MGEPNQPFGAGQSTDERGKSDSPELTTAVIHDVFDHAGAYVVRPLGGGTRLATTIQSVSTSPLGAREINHYQIGDTVLCVFLPIPSYGLIIGSVPPQMYDPRFVLPSSLVQRSGMGFFYEQMHYSIFQNDKLGLANFSCGRPLDAVQGDWGYINELGAALWLGKFMAQIRGSELAKMECFWGDDLVRLFAYNRQLYTASRDLFEFDDEGECSLVEKWTPFVWESFGSYTAGEEVFEENVGDAGGIKRDGEEKSRFEPKEEKQDMVFRGMNLRGYLGDIKRDMVVLVPPDGDGIAKKDDEKKYRGVLDVHCGMDGAFHVRSAKEIILAKTVMIPVPRQLLDPDDPSGDSATTGDKQYKPANQYGSGTDQEQKPYKYPEDVEEPPGRLVDLWDYQAYLFGKFGLQTVDAHEKDWKAPEESEVEYDTGEANEIDDDVYKAGGSGLEFQPFAPLPKYAEITIDQRSGHDVRYYKSRSGVFILDDGSVSIEDGYGAQVLLSGGHIQASCPGDFKARPGRNFIAWAPRDFIARAGYCADISAAKADVRIKAEKNLHAMAGDGTVGSIMFENRAAGKPAKTEWDGKQGDDIETSGIIFKAEDSVIHLLTGQLFGGTTKDDSEAWVELNSGTGKTTLGGGDVGIEATKLYGVLVGSGRKDTGCASQFVISPSNAVLISSLDMVGDLGLWQGCKGGGNLEMDGQQKVKGSIGSDGSISCEGVMSANGMSSNSIHNGTGGGSGPDVQSKGGETQSRAEAAKDPLYEDFETDTLDDEDRGAASQALWDVIGFSFRSSQQFKTDGDYKVFESRSQQMYRAFGINKQWDEPQVDAPNGTPTRPHPGQETWTDGSKYRYAEPGSAQNVDFTKGIAKERESQTEEGLELQQGSLESDYVITIQEE